MLPASEENESIAHRSSSALEHIDGFAHAPTCAATDATCPTRWLTRLAVADVWRAASQRNGFCLRGHACVHASGGFAGARACMYALRGGRRAPGSVCTLAHATLPDQAAWRRRCRETRRRPEPHPRRWRPAATQVRLYSGRQCAAQVFRMQACVYLQRSLRMRCLRGGMMSRALRHEVTVCATHVTHLATQHAHVHAESARRRRIRRRPKRQLLRSADHQRIRSGCWRRRRRRRRRWSRRQHCRQRRGVGGGAGDGRELGGDGQDAIPAQVREDLNGHSADPPVSQSARCGL